MVVVEVVVWRLMLTGWLASSLLRNDCFDSLLPPAPWVIVWEESWLPSAFIPYYHRPPG